MAKPTSTPTCIPEWRRPRAKRVSPKSPIGSRRWPRPRSRTRASSQRLSPPSPNREFELKRSGSQTKGGLGGLRSSTRRPPIAPIRFEPDAGARQVTKRMGRIESTPTEGLSYDPNDPRYWNRAELQKEIVRVYDICLGCRLCFNLCPSFPALFEAADTKDGDVLALTRQEQQRVVDLCYGCKLC